MAVSQRDVTVYYLDHFTFETIIKLPISFYFRSHFTYSICLFSNDFLRITFYFIIRSHHALVMLYEGGSAWRFLLRCISLSLANRFRVCQYKWLHCDLYFLLYESLLHIGARRGLFTNLSWETIKENKIVDYCCIYFIVPLLI